MTPNLLISGVFIRERDTGRMPWAHGHRLEWSIYMLRNSKDCWGPSEAEDKDSLLELQRWAFKIRSQDFPDDSVVKNLPASAGDAGSISELGRSPGEGNATHSSILAWRTPWTEEPGRLQSMRSQKSRTQLSDYNKLSVWCVTPQNFFK